jgi:hypothetical protein
LIDEIAEAEHALPCRAEQQPAHKKITSYISQVKGGNSMFFDGESYWKGLERNP